MVLINFNTRFNRLNWKKGEIDSRLDASYNFCDRLIRLDSRFNNRSNRFEFSPGNTENVFECCSCSFENYNKTILLSLFKLVASECKAIFH